jgi:hypothetical protein
MRFTTWFVLALASGCPLVAAQGVTDRELARQLAKSATRQTAVASIVASGSAKLPLLLSWTRNSPQGVDKAELYLGLAEAFGGLRTKDAIPFLMKNISMQRFPSSPDVWMKTTDVIEERLPAVSALIQIGPEASRALMQAFPSMEGADRLAAIVAVSRIKGVPDAQSFLASVSGQANMERVRAEQGLKLLNQVP